MKWRPDPGRAAAVATPCLRLLAGSWRTEIRHRERWQALAGRPFLFLLWHEVLVPLLWHHRHDGVAIVVSDSHDGRYLRELARRLGYQALLGSSSKGGVRALLAAVRALKAGTAVAMTPDGPRGPRRELKPGILAAAQRSGAVILPIHAEIDGGWRLRSWDRLVIPKPFARVRIGYGETFAVAPGAGGIAQGAETAYAALATLEREMTWQGAAATDID